MTAILYRSPSGWNLMLTFSDVRTGFASPASARSFAAVNGWRVRRSPKLDY
jgi:hypothetical protein